VQSRDTVGEAGQTAGVEGISPTITYGSWPLAVRVQLRRKKHRSQGSDTALSDRSGLGAGQISEPSCAGWHRPRLKFSSRWNGGTAVDKPRRNLQGRTKIRDGPRLGVQFQRRPMDRERPRLGALEPADLCGVIERGPLTVPPRLSGAGGAGGATI